MSTRIKVFASAALLASAMFAGIRLSPVASGQAQAKPQRWEYKVVDLVPWIVVADRDKAIRDYTDGCNELGAAGWELVSAGGDRVAVFKRPKR